MGTRSTTHIVEIPAHLRTTGIELRKISRLKPLVSIYGQCDGYPSGHGKDIAKFIKKMQIVNGIRGGHVAGTHANGAGCFAAQFIKRFKTGIGSIYVTDASDRQDYDYFIYIGAEDDYFSPPLASIILVRVKSDKQTLFYGGRDEYLKWVAGTAD